MYDRIVELLAAIGYNTISDSDRIILNFAISKVESEIKNEINWKVDEGGESASGRLSTFINYLLTYGADQFSAFRRIRW